MACEQFVIAAVSLPGDIKRVAQEGNCADQHRDGNIGRHADERDVGNSAYPGCDGNQQGSEAGEHVAQARHKPDDAIQAEAYGGSWDAEPVIQYVSEQIKIAIVEPAAAFAQQLGGAALRRCRCLRADDASGSRHRGKRNGNSLLQSKVYVANVAAIVKRQNAWLWSRMSWVRSPLAAPVFRSELTLRDQAR